MGGINTFEVDGSRKRDPVGRPSTSVGQEELGLRRAAGIGRACKVVRAAYDMDTGRTIIVAVEVRVDERCIFVVVNNQRQYNVQTSVLGRRKYRAQLVLSVA